MRYCFKSALVVLGISIAAITMAQSSYVQAIPQPANSNASMHAKLDQTNARSLQPSKASSQPATLQNQVAASAMAQSAQNTLLLSRLMQVNDDMSNYKSATNQKLAQLQSMQQQIMAQLSQLQQQVTAMQTKAQASKQTTAKMGMLKSTQTHPQQDYSVESLLQRWQRQIGKLPFYALLAVLVLIVFFIVNAIISGLKKKSSASNNDGDDVKSDYDYLATKESIPAKFDLVRAYMAMGDHQLAKEVLNEICGQGDDEQKSQAKKMLKEIEAGTQSND